MTEQRFGSAPRGTRHGNGRPFAGTPNPQAEFEPPKPKKLSLGSFTSSPPAPAAPVATALRASDFPRFIPS